MFTLVVHFFYYLCVSMLPCMPVKCKFETIVLLRFLPNKTIIKCTLIY